MQIMSRSKKWEVSIPITGYITVEVEAESEQEAIELGLDSSDLTIDNIVEWKAHEYIAKGNVCYASVNTAEATPLKD